MPTRKVKHLVLFGPENLIEYYTSKALMIRGYPVAKSKREWLPLLLLTGRWSDLGFSINAYNWRRPMRSISLHFPYPEPPQAFIRILEKVQWKVVEVEVQQQQ